MEIEQEVYDRFEQATNLIDKIRIMVEEMNQTEVAYNKMPGEVEVVDDIALIQSFYGVEPERIRATTIALNFMLQMTRRPSTWVFVECQKKKTDCVFGWLSNYGIKHKFVKMNPENEGIFLKTPLWNIGTTLCSESKLCFVDSDVVMCDSDWIEKAYEAFNEYDVLSLSSHQYYEDGECELKESIGYKWATTGSVKSGHCGFTLGMTRDVFNKLNGFDATLILDDIQTYYRICGECIFRPFKDWVKSFTLKKNRMGIPCRLGYVETVSCHVWHGDFPGKYETMVKLMDKSGITSSDDIFDYDKRNGFATLPQWKKNSKKCIAIRNTIKEFQSWMLVIENQNREYDIVSEFTKQMTDVMGRIDDKHKLFVCTVVPEKGFGINVDKFTNFRDIVDERVSSELGVQPIVVFFTNIDDLDLPKDEFNIVPCKNLDYDNLYKQCLRKDLKIPDGSVIYYVPFCGHNEFNPKIWIPEGIEINSDGTVLIGK